MNRQWIVTIAGIVLAGLIAVGSMMLTRYLLDRKEDSLYGKEETLADQNELVLVNDDIQYENLLPEQIFDVLERWDNNYFTVDQAPFKNQLDEDEAVQAVKDFLKDMAEKKVIPEGIFDLEEMSYTASLFYPMQSYNIGDYVIDPVYSMWEIYFYDRHDISVNVKLHASTGKVWELFIYYLGENKFQNFDGEQAVKIYADYLNLENLIFEEKNASESDGQQMFGNNIAYYYESYGTMRMYPIGINTSVFDETGDQIMFNLRLVCF